MMTSMRPKNAMAMGLHQKKPMLILIPLLIN